jgi:hypothetical protein
MLTPEQVFDPLTDVKDELNSINIEADQMQAPYAPFAVNLSIPYIAHDVLPSGVVTIPFVLPPLQDTFATETVGSDVLPINSPDTPQVLLTGVSFSFDQRDEPAAIASQFYKNASSTAGGLPSAEGPGTSLYAQSGDQGRLLYQEVGRYNIFLAIREKEQSFFGDPAPYAPQNEIWSTLIPSVAFSGRYLRANPFIQTDIDVVVNRYKTMFLVISCPELRDPAAYATGATQKNLALAGIEVSLRFRHQLVSRDTGSSIQNIPDDGGSGEDKYGAKTAPTVTITAPADGTPIEADSAGGVSYNITAIDNEFRAKLEGGYNKFADVPPTEVIKDDAAYEVIAVPLFGNKAHGGICSHQQALATEPYLMEEEYDGSDPDWKANRALFDRRIIQLRHSLTIHHAFLAWNWTPFKPFVEATTGAMPNFDKNMVHAPPSADIEMMCGVGIGTGLRADDFKYEQVAALTLADPCGLGELDETKVRGWGEGTSLVDRMVTTEDPPLRMKYAGGSPTDEDIALALEMPGWNWEMHSMPLVGSSGKGYYAQGKPLFAGPGWTNTEDRQDAGGSAPSTAGAEQWIEVRCALYSKDEGAPSPGTSGILANTPFFYYDEGSPWETNMKDMPVVFVGYGGCWVYLICKKHLTR